MAHRDGAHRTITMKGLGRKRDTVTTSAGRVARSNPGMYGDATFNSVSAGARVMGGNRPLAPLPNIPRFSAPNPNAMVRKRGRIDQIAQGQGASRRRLDIGGNTPGQLREMAGTALGSGMRAPQFGQGAPTLSRFSRDQDGLPIGSGFPSKPDPFVRGQMPTGQRGENGHAWSNMPAKPRVFDLSKAPGRNMAGLGGTRSNSMFPAISSGTGNPRQGTTNPFTGYDYDNAASQVQDGTKTGRPNAAVKYTYILTHASALYARYTQAAMPWFAPIKLIRKDGVERQGILGWKAPDPLHDGFNLPVANYMLACEQPRPDKFEQVMTVEDVLDHWKFSGIVAAEHGEDFSRFTDSNNPTGGVSRKLVVQQQGEVDLFNFWGDVSYGQEVGIILKGVPARLIYAHNYHEHGTYNIDATSPASFTAVDLLTHTSVPLQFVPWFSEKDGATAPTDVDKAYFDHLGVKHYGKYFKIGTVLQDHQPNVDENAVSRAPFSAVAAVNCGKIRVVVDAYKDV